MNMENAFNPLVKAITQSTKPVVNAINGIAAGGGVGVEAEMEAGMEDGAATTQTSKITA